MRTLWALLSFCCYHRSIQPSPGSNSWKVQWHHKLRCAHRKTRIDRIEIKIDKVEGGPSKGPSPTSARGKDICVATFLSWPYLKATS